jgi:hypothetical protein
MTLPLIDRLDYPVNARPFALFRIGLGAVLVLQYIDLIYFRHLLGERWPVHGTAILATVATLGIITALWLSAGFYTRIASVASYACVVATFGIVTRRLGVFYAADGFMIAASLLCVLIPTGRALSLDRHWGIEKRCSISNLANVLLIVVLSVSYLDAVSIKLGEDLWLSGLGVWLPLTQPWAVFFTSDWFLDSEFLAKSAGYSALAFQILFPVLVWLRPLRLPLVLIGIGMHVGIAVSFPCPVFGLLMCVYFLPLLRVERMPETEREPRWPLLACMAVYLVTLPIINIHSPLNARIRYIYSFTGIESHGLFLQSHWLNHPTEYRLEFTDATGTQTIPTTRESGYAGLYVLERRWCVTNFYRYSADLDTYLPTIEHLVSRWAGERTGQVSIYTREPETPDKWRPGVLRENRERPWRLERKMAWPFDKGE